MRSTKRVGLIVILAALACSDPGILPPDDDGPSSLSALVVSDAVQGSSTGEAIANGAAAVAFLSLPPGTLSNAVRAVIRNLSASGAAPVQVAIIDGGFDPVAIAGDVGDLLELELTYADGGTEVVHSEVPPRRPPVVLRTAPPRGRTDVPLDVRPLVVFSEPIDPASITPVSIRLLAAGMDVGGESGPVAGKPWAVEFRPDAPLEAAASYELVITGVRDLQGDRLETPVTVPFTTAAAPLDARIAFVSDRDGAPAIYLANADGSAATRLTSGEAPAWSWDGTRIAFQRGPSGPGPPGIYVMGADGSDLRWLGGGGNPAWSPDDTWIVFNGQLDDASGILVTRSDGSGGPTLLLDSDFTDRGPAAYGTNWVGYPSWSPDGQSIAFVQGNYGVPWWVYIMNADGTDPRLLSQDGWTKNEPVWSPDGSAIAVVTADRAPGDCCSARALGTYDPNTGSRRIHHRDPPLGYIGSPDWSPDGRTLLFDQWTLAVPDGGGYRGERDRILAVSIQTGTIWQLIPDAVNPANPDYRDYDAAWSRVNR